MKQGDFLLIQDNGTISQTTYCTYTVAAIVAKALGCLAIGRCNTDTTYEIVATIDTNFKLN